jgi:hypothetical protein
MRETPSMWFERSRRHSPNQANRLSFVSDAPWSCVEQEGAPVLSMENKLKTRGVIGAGAVRWLKTRGVLGAGATSFSDTVPGKQ